MGSPLSVVVAEIVMQNIEEAPFRPADKRYRFGYATLTILSPPYDTTKSTHSTTTLTVKALTNSLRGVEENGKLPFLDCLVNRDDNSLRITVYRKPTHTDRLLDESSSSSSQPDIIQSHCYQDSYATSVTSMQHDRQLIWREKLPSPCFFKEQLQLRLHST